MSISGWYHGPSPPKGADLASLNQIMKVGDDNRPFTPIHHSNESSGIRQEKESIVPETTSSDMEIVAGSVPPSDEDLILTENDLNELKRWINGTYLNDDAINKINEQFCEESSIQLKDFLKKEIYDEIAISTKQVDIKNNVGHSKLPIASSSYEKYFVGAENGWKLVGPPHKRRHLLYNCEDKITSDIPVTKEFSTKLSEFKADLPPGMLLDMVRVDLMHSVAFAKYLKRLTALTVVGVRDEIRRFRPGMDYTVAHYGAMTKIPRLDATLCFVDEGERSDSGEVEKEVEKEVKKEVKKEISKGGDMKSKSDERKNDKEDDGNDDDNSDEGDDDDEEDEDDDGGGPWESGDVGGFECYIEADMQDTAEAAEVYRPEPAQGSTVSLIE